MAPKQVKYAVDFSEVAKFKVDLQTYQNFLNDRIKVNGKTGALGNQVVVSVEKNKVVVTATTAFSKRYLKYLTKKYLKANDMKDFMRVVASDKNTYAIRMYKVVADSQED